MPITNTRMTQRCVEIKDCPCTDSFTLQDICAFTHHSICLLN